MTKLESELLEAIMANTYIETLDEMTDIEKEAVSRATAEVAKKYIEKAFIDGCSYMISKDSSNEEDCAQWLKENGVI